MKNKLQVERVPIDSVTPDPDNANTHPESQIEHLKASLARFGQLPTILLDKHGTVIKGNGTLEAAKRLGFTEVDVIKTPFEGDEARAFAIADNRIAQESEWDLERLEAQLAGLTADVEGLGSLGFDEDSLAELVGLVPIDGVYVPVSQVPATDKAAPEEFKEIDETLETDHQCPKCGYAWSGSQT